MKLGKSLSQISEICEKNSQHIGRKHLMTSFKVWYSPDACCPGVSIITWKAPPKLHGWKHHPLHYSSWLKPSSAGGFFCCGGHWLPGWCSGRWPDLEGWAWLHSCPTPQWGWWKSWFSLNCLLEHLHVASPAWQFTLTNLKETRDLKWWLQALREECSSGWCLKLGAFMCQPWNHRASSLLTESQAHAISRVGNTKPYSLMRKGSKNLQPCVKAGIHAYVYWSVRWPNHTCVMQLLTPCMPQNVLFKGS